MKYKSSCMQWYAKEQPKSTYRYDWYVPEEIIALQQRVKRIQEANKVATNPQSSLSLSLRNVPKFNRKRIYSLQTSICIYELIFSRLWEMLPVNDRHTFLCKSHFGWPNYLKDNQARRFAIRMLVDKHSKASLKALIRLKVIPDIYNHPDRVLHLDQRRSPMYRYTDGFRGVKHVLSFNNEL